MLSISVWKVSTIFEAVPLPAESISSALKWLCMDGRFPKDELDGYLEEYSFCEGSLAELLENELHKEKMDEFFVFLKNLREKM